MRKELKEARLAKGLTQEQLAAMTGLKSKGHYCMIEKGRRGVSIELALRIAEVLGQPVEKLFFTPKVNQTKIQVNEQAATSEFSAELAG
jgi:putative transcriptional regulator